MTNTSQMLLGSLGRPNSYGMVESIAVSIGKTYSKVPLINIGTEGMTFPKYLGISNVSAQY